LPASSWRPDITDAEGHRTPALVWYAGYGSNLCAERFLCYIEGGTPPGLSRPSRGARDQTPPGANRPLDIPHRLYFAGSSTSWGGAPCFVDTVENPSAPAHARAYLITWEQFEDLLAQENGRSTRRIELEPTDLAAGRSIRLGPGRYENLVCLDGFDGVPVVTITSPWAMAEAPLDAPSPAYLKVLIAGLRESHAMSDDAIVAYLDAAPGCSGALVTSVLAPGDESEG
jgi:hypothetical protein